MKMRTLIISVVVLVLLAPLAAAQVTTQLPLPADLQGELDGAPYRILVPANWNGVLLVFVHGFVSPSVDVVPATTPAVQPSLQEQLLTLGYALAASNSESVEKKAVQSTVALTGFFKEQVGPPKRIIVWGVSFGSGVALKLIEKHSGIYDGAIANCAVSAGTAENMDAALAFSLAYAAAFTWHDDLWGPVGDVRDGLNATQEVLPVMKTDGTVPATLAFGRWEFIEITDPWDAASTIRSFIASERT